MKTWKPWQIVLLVYLLTLNLAVFGILAFYFFNSLFSPAASESVAVAPVETPTTITQLPATPVPEPVEFTIPTPTVEEKMVEESDGPDYIPPVNIPPAPPPDEAIAVSSNLEPTDTPQSVATATPTFLPTNTPQPPTSTPTLTASPTRTATSTPSSTPTSTSTATSTPQPTATPTRTATPRPTATSTPTRTTRPSATPTRTPTRPPTNTPTPLPTPTNSPTPLAAIIDEAVSAIASTLSGADINPQPNRPAQTIASEPGLMDALPLTNGSIALSWPLADKTQQYRIYSDMGSGYGVFVYKARTTQPTFIDEQLRSGMTYIYRLTGLEANQEVVLAQVKAHTFARDTIANRSGSGQSEVSTASVTAAPTALPSDAILLGLVSDNNFTDDFNTLTVVGEFRNDSNVEVGQTDITVTFYDTAGAVIGTANGETMLETISPGEKSPFLIALTRPPGFASYSIRAVGRHVPAAKQSAQLSVVEVRRYEDEAGFFHIEGIIQNTGNTTARRTKVAAIIYGRDHGVINVGFTYVNPPTLDPGEQATYEVIFAYYPRYLTQQVIPFEE